MNKTKQTEYKPDYVSAPGETLQETLHKLGISQAELAERTGRPKKTINEIIQGKAAITPETALQLELVLRIPSRFWLAREAAYRAWLARQEENLRISKDVSFLKNLPVKEMIANGWLEKAEDKCEQAKAALSFFGVVSSDKIPLIEPVAFRQSQAFAVNQWALAAWLRRGELEAQRLPNTPYHREHFFKALVEIQTITTEKPSVFVPQMQALCLKSGVILIFVNELPKTSVSGATRWLGQTRPLIQLSLRYKTDDMFWFSFFHEAGHVYLEHAKREILLEDKFKDTLDQRELAANRFAMDLLIPADKFESYLAKNNFTHDSIKRFASSLGIAPGIVVGRLQYERKVDWKQFRDLKRSITWDDL